jgi:hypothetical protein
MPLIPEAPNPVLPPNTPAGQTPATPAAPNVPSGQAAVNPAVPNVPSGQAAVNPAAPNVPSGQAAVSPAIPNTPTGIAAVDPAAPNASSAETAINPSAPNLLGNTAENLMVYSENLNATGWTIFEAIVFNDQNFAPDGTLSADLLRDTVVNTIHRAAQIIQAPIIAGRIYTFSVYVKAQNGNRGISLREDTTDSLAIFVNPNDGVINTSVGLLQSSSVNVGNGWYRISMTGVVSVANPAFELRLTQTPTSTVTSYAGNAIDGVVLWGAQVNAGSLGPYIPTLATFKTGTLVSIPNTPATQTPVDPAAPNVITALAPSGEIRSVQPLFNFNASLGLPSTVVYTRASSASYIERFRNARGSYDKRLVNDFVGVVENTALYSEDFDNAAWLKTDTTVVKKQSEFVITEGNSATEHRVDQALIAIANSCYTVTAKANKGNRGIALRLGNSFQVIFDLVNGRIQAISAPAVGSIKFVGDGFYECTIYLLAPQTTQTARINLTDAGGNLAYQGDSVSGVIFKRVQLTISTKPLPYVRTFGVAVSATQVAKPRYEEKGLLIEGAVTNVALRSEQFDNASWLKSSSTINANQALAPDGSFSADKFFAASTASIQPYINQTITGAATALQSFSVFVKQNEARFIQFIFGSGEVVGDPRANFNLSNGSLGSVDPEFTAQIKSINNGWYKISVSGLANSTTLRPRLVLIKSATDTRAQSNSWAGGDGLFVWGAQLEALPFASSYIRTEGSAVTRALDVCGQNLYSTSREITILTENSYLVSPALNANNRAAMSFRNTLGGERFLSYNGSGVPSRMFVQSGATSITLPGVAVTNDSLVKTVSSMTAISGTSYQDGELVGTVAIDSFPINMAFLHIGGNSANGRPLYGHISRIEIYELALTASEAKAL